MDQRAIWNQVAIERDRSAHRLYHRVWEHMLEVTGAASGARLLDAGCGSGGASQLALRRGAQVTGVDISNEMIALCSGKPELAGGTFRVASLEQLPFADASFDAAIACMVIHFCDSNRAVRELARVLVPGGRIAIAAPSAIDVDSLIAFNVAAELRPEHAAEINRPQMFAPPRKLIDLLTSVGLREVQEHVVENKLGPMPFDELWALQMGWAPVRQTVDHVGESKFLSIYRQRLRHCFSPDGLITLDASFRVVSGLR